MSSGYRELIDRIKQTDPEKIVFWVGAGIDSNDPTGLPRAEPLVKEIMDLTCGEEIASKIFKICRELNGRFPRLESIIEEIKRFESNLQSERADQTFLKGFESFLQAPPNVCHEVLAQYIRLGANVVTTNYGRTIPEALRQIDPKSDFCESPYFDQSLGIYVYRSLKRNYGAVYHIHGVANDLKTMGVSLSEVKTSLPKGFRKMVLEWINSGYTFIFLGYSCSDTLDVNMFFEEARADTINNQSFGLFIQHSSDIKIYEDPPRNVIAVLETFGDREYYLAPTETFVNELALAPSRLSQQAKAMFDWQFMFRDYAKQGRVFDEDILKVRISHGYIYSLGLNVRAILPSNWLRMAADGDGWYGNFHAFVNACKNGRFKDIVRYKTKYRKEEESQLTTSNVYAYSGRLKQASEVVSLSEIESGLATFIENGKPVDWSISTPLNRKSQWIIINTILPILGHKNKEKLRDEAQQIIKLNKRIIGLGTDGVVDVLQLLTAKRLNAVLQAIFCEKGKKEVFDHAIGDLMWTLYHYTEISNYTGMSFSEMFLFLVKILEIQQGHEKKMPEEYKQHMQTAKRIINKNKSRWEWCLYWYLIIFWRCAAFVSMCKRRFSVLPK